MARLDARPDGAADAVRQQRQIGGIGMDRADPHPLGQHDLGGGQQHGIELLRPRPGLGLRQGMAGLGEHLRFAEPEFQFVPGQQHPGPGREQHIAFRQRFAETGGGQKQRPGFGRRAARHRVLADPEERLIAVVARQHPIPRAQPVDRHRAFGGGNHRAAAQTGQGRDFLGAGGAGGQFERFGLGIVGAGRQHFGGHVKAQHPVDLDPVKPDRAAAGLLQHQRHIGRQRALQDQMAHRIAQLCPRRAMRDLPQHRGGVKIMVQRPKPPLGIEAKH